MSKKPEVSQPIRGIKISTPDFQPLTTEEASQIRGGGWGAGTCVGVGYACWSKGGIKVALCAIGGFGKGL